ncbi:HIT family protein [Amycolatopsis decaplanina]|uniref:HIT domain-containing protein n=1 Tax=Amycolatopsis decaplanina DSM 44594 TaxID=1284240 RepID=M2Z9N8_9PSEU|nr:HIT domain-containing protein [Amycolatopsis decaplanina]EME57653.1 hypothetical protein H074_20722 [Amycolatopsis decaplanina DSM 44594]
MTVEETVAATGCATAGYDANCSFCAEFERGAADSRSAARSLVTPSRPERVIWSDDDLVVVPTLGPVAKGHVMVLTREHYLSYAHVPRGLAERAEALAETVCRRISGLGTPIMFEHGPMSEGATGGACTDHAHLHCVPMGEVDLKAGIDERLTGRRISSLVELADQRRRRQPYIYYRSGSGVSWLYDVDVDLPCQFLRRLANAALGDHEEWDWLTFPKLDLVYATLDEISWSDK